MASLERRFSLSQPSVLSLAKNISMGLRSGEYLGRKKSFGAHGPDGGADRLASMGSEIVP